jgi:3-dehydroquinate synthase II
LPEIIVDLSEGLPEELDKLIGAGVQNAIISKKAIDNNLLLLSVRNATGNESKGAWLRISNALDLDRAVKTLSDDYEYTIVECIDWKVIPLENLVAESRRKSKKLYVVVREASEIDLAITILEKGAHGVVIPPNLLPDAKRQINNLGGIKLHSSTVVKIMDAGLGDRVCLDTTSQLTQGEGILIGSRGGYFFLVHGETIENQYIATRPFRVNAGAIHSYVLIPGWKTKYLSEFSAGDRVLVVQKDGKVRDVTVGRVKIERRPMVLIEATSGKEQGSIILQNAETVRLVKTSGEPVSVTELKEGDEVLTSILEQKARHLGGEVDEYIIER